MTDAPTQKNTLSGEITRNDRRRFLTVLAGALGGAATGAGIAAFTTPNAKPKYSPHDSEALIDDSLAQLQQTGLAEGLTAQEAKEQLLAVQDRLRRQVVPVSDVERIDAIKTGGGAGAATGAVLGGAVSALLERRDRMKAKPPAKTIDK